ncbi:unnamed protein product [Paramecium octaurelia]|uniref:Uncharacterized protein n=1 Tax=Paramecium octaurelia TaxID=43137 RepID=A0A8S1VFB5_PAROT|nr:unnamed protein product [Paramecium octaurelia]
MNTVNFDLLKQLFQELCLNVDSQLCYRCSTYSQHNKAINNCKINTQTMRIIFSFSIPNSDCLILSTSAQIILFSFIPSQSSTILVILGNQDLRFTNVIYAYFIWRSCSQDVVIQTDRIDINHCSNPINILILSEINVKYSIIYCCTTQNAIIKTNHSCNIIQLVGLQQLFLIRINNNKVTVRSTVYNKFTLRAKTSQYPIFQLSQQLCDSSFKITCEQILFQSQEYDFL